MQSASSIITTLGAGSGINMAQLATDLAQAQFQLRSDRLSAQGEKLERQISLASTIRNALSTLASSLGDRVRTGDLAAVPQVANATVAQASAPPGTTGRGTYALEVTQLASGQTLAGPAMAAAADPVGAGTLTIRFGAMDGTSFAADGARDPVNITIASGSSLADIAREINRAGAGVSAYVAQTVDGARLVMKGAQGAANGFVIEASETPGEEGLSALAWAPASGGADRLLDTSRDALFLLDGLAMQSASNRTGQVAPGLALTLSGTNAGNPTSISFGNPASAISATMRDLVDALNEIAGGLRDATNIETGDLRGDPGARALRQQLAGLAGKVVMRNAPEDAPRTLADLGLAIQRDGTYRLDTDRLNATLARDPQGAAAMFTTGLFGVFATVDSMAREAGRTGNPGSLAGSVARFQRQAGQVSERAADLLEKQESLRARMVARFARADTRIAASQSTLGFLQQQIDAWNSDRR